MESSVIASIGYAFRERVLEIEFRTNGHVYDYLDVPPEEHAALLQAESKGTYLNQVFKPRHHPYIRVR